MLHLRDQEASVAFRESTFLAGHNHLQHVSMKLLHDDKDVLDGLEHPLQQNHTRVGQTLDNTETRAHILNERFYHEHRARASR